MYGNGTVSEAPNENDIFFNRTTKDTAMNEQVGCGEERRRGGVGGGCWRCGILPRGGPYGWGGVRPTGRTFFLPFSPILFGCIAGSREIKIPAFMITEGHRSRSGLVFGRPHVFCSCWLGLMGALPSTAAVASGMLHRRGFLASLARRHLLHRPIDWPIDAPVVQSISSVMICYDY